jgi:hypothetical protein
MACHGLLLGGEEEHCLVMVAVAVLLRRVMRWVTWVLCSLLLIEAVRKQSVIKAHHQISSQVAAAHGEIVWKIWKN